MNYIINDSCDLNNPVEVIISCIHYIKVFVLKTL